MLKTAFERLISIVGRYRSFKNFSESSLRRKIESDANLIQFRDRETLQALISKHLNTEAPLKKRILSGNNKPHIGTSRIRKEYITSKKGLKSILS